MTFWAAMAATYNSATYCKTQIWLLEMSMSQFKDTFQSQSCR